jgi:hypothetical protein
VRVLFASTLDLLQPPTTPNNSAGQPPTEMLWYNRTNNNLYSNRITTAYFTSTNLL